MDNIATLQGPASPALREPSDPGKASVARRPVRLGGPLVALAALLLAVVAAFILTRPGPSPPADAAATVVPADALGYVHLSIDPRRGAVRQAQKLAARLPDFPLISATAITRLDAMLGDGSPVDFGRDIRPWLGREAAVALLDTSTGTAGSLTVLGVRHPQHARSFLLRAGASISGTYDGAQLYRYRSGTELAFVSHYLALGQDASVREALDAGTGRTPSLMSSTAYRNAAAGEPDGRVLDAYVSAAGVRRVLESRTGALGALGVMLDQPALAGTAISVSPTSHGATIRVHSALDPAFRRPSGSRAPSFSPTLQGVLPTGSMLLLDTKSLARAVPRVLTAAATMGIAGRIGPLLARLGAALSAEGVNVPSLMSLFSGETAVAIVPTRFVGGVPQSSSLVILAKVRDEAATEDELGSLETPLTQLFPPPSDGPGQAPVFNDRQVAGITARQLALAPGLQLDYAVFHNMLVVSTSLDGIAGVAHHARSLAHDRGFESTQANRPEHVSSLVFLDFSQLLTLGEQTGLIRSGQLTKVRPDLDRVRAIGLDSTSGESDTTAELYLQIS